MNGLLNVKSHCHCGVRYEGELNALSSAGIIHYCVWVIIHNILSISLSLILVLVDPIVGSFLESSDSVKSSSDR